MNAIPSNIKAKTGWLFLFCTAMLFALASCGGESSVSPEEPPVPVKKNDTIEIKINNKLEVTQQQLVTKSEASRDLIGIEIKRKTVQPDNYNPWLIYASGVFDNIEDIVFKFVKGGTYQIRMTYFPNAKDIVYEYEDGTFGAPFSYLYGLQEYSLNEPVYFGGVAGGWSGDSGPTLNYIHSDVYQPTEDRYIQSFKRASTPRYSGMIEEITVNEQTDITVQLKLCLMAITLKPENFTEGKLALSFPSRFGESWEVSPDDDMTLKMQTGYEPGVEDMYLFYTDAEGSKYLLATKRLEKKHNANFIFSFRLTEREDGGIGLQMPTEEEMEDEETKFDS